MSERLELENESVEARLGQIADEFTDRINRGDRPDVEDYARRYPEMAVILRQVLPALQVMGPCSPQDDPCEAQATGEVAESGFLGDFRIVREVGKGGMGIVYEAEQISLRRRVALKVLPFAATMDPRHLQRFHNEARAAACLHHTNIVPVHYVGCERGIHFYAMQFIEGQTLGAVIDELRQHVQPPKATEIRPREPLSAVAEALTSGRLAPAAPLQASPPSTPSVPPPGAPATPATESTPQAGLSTERSIKDGAFFRSVAHLGIQAAEALDHAHHQGIVHRDIKPANLLVDVHSNLWITDFGLAQFQTDARLTQTGDLVGTLRYMSPEQAMAQRPLIDHRTDIYSLGATLYELLTLQPAIDGQERLELLRKIEFEEPKPPRRHNNALPPELELIVLKALEKDPTQRYGTAKELADDLRRFLEDRPVSARRPTLWQRANKWARRHKSVVRAFSLGLALAVVVLAVSTLLVWRAYRAEAEQRQLADAHLREAREQRRQARQAVDTMYLEVAQKWLENQPQKSELQKQFLEKVLHYYQAFAEAEGEDEDAQFDKATAYLSVSQLLISSVGTGDQAQAPLRKAIAILEELADKSSDKGVYTLKLAQGLNLLAFSGAENRRQNLERAVSLLDDLVERYPAEPEYRYGLAARLTNL
jgi:serine/threonine protein kinase